MKTIRSVATARTVIMFAFQVSRFEQL